MVKRIHNWLRPAAAPTNLNPLHVYDRSKSETYHRYRNVLSAIENLEVQLRACEETCPDLRFELFQKKQMFSDLMEFEEDCLKHIGQRR